MEVGWPENAEEILRKWPSWFTENGRVYTRHMTTGWRVEGVWIECEHCGEVAPAWKSNAKRFCSRDCRNAGMVGASSGNWRGGRWTNKAGYVRVTPTGKRRVFEHRYVMEQILGRELLDYERVHHKNGVRDDNRPENLELWVSGHPVGIRVTDAPPHCATCTCFDH